MKTFLSSLDEGGGGCTYIGSGTFTAESAGGVIFSKEVYEIISEFSSTFTSLSLQYERKKVASIA